MGKYYKTEDIPLICELYKQRKLDEIFERFPGLTLTALRSLCSRRNVHVEGVFWTEYDTNFLIQKHGILTNKQIAKALEMRHSPSCVATKAKSLGLKNNRYWTEQELEILKNNYSTKTFDEVLKLLPNRTSEAILGQAKKLGIHSKYNVETYYTEEQKQYIINNFNILSDIEIANALNKPLSGVQEQRRKMGLYYRDNEYLGYDNFQRFFRAKLSNWRNKSIKNCNNKCIITGDSKYDIHHLYSFHLIFRETMDYIITNNYYKSDNINDYNSDELNILTNIFLDIHNKYPLGICIRSDIHRLFHNTYKGWDNTEEQWNEFINKLDLSDI